MLNQSRRSLKATEDSTKATLRSTAALNKMTDTLRAIMREEDAATPPPLPKQGATPSKNQPPKK
jgi:hypothetical protein